MLSDTIISWVSEARRLANDELGTLYWAAETARRVNNSPDTDLGTMVVARAVLSRAATEHAAAVVRQQAEEAARASAAREQEEARTRAARAQGVASIRHEAGTALLWGSVGYLFFGQFVAPIMAIRVISRARREGITEGLWPAYLTLISWSLFTVVPVALIVTGVIPPQSTTTTTVLGGIWTVWMIVGTIMAMSARRRT